MKKYKWKRRGGFECSSKGRGEYSAFSARLDNGMTIEETYQIEVKGYKSIREGKGKPPLNKMTRQEQWEAYYSLWVKWAKVNRRLINILREEAKEFDYTLSDMFANTDINQARALADILNDYDNIYASPFQTFKVIIAGSRSFDPNAKQTPEFYFNEIDKVINKQNKHNFKVEIVSGTANGADIFGELYSEVRNTRIKRFPAKWEEVPEGVTGKIGKNGKVYWPGAGHKRNQDMGDYADVLIAFWDGKSKGTEGMIKYMKKLKKPVTIIWS